MDELKAFFEKYGFKVHEETHTTRLQQDLGIAPTPCLKLYGIMGDIEFRFCNGQLEIEMIGDGGSITKENCE